MIAGLILAKANSTRLPNKNILPYKSEPMFLTNVKKCLKLFDKVYVSSDSQEILDMAQKIGAIGILRGEELCGDVPDIPVFQHALTWMDRRVRGIVAVHANNPTIDEKLIHLVGHLLHESDVPEVMTCYPFEYTGVYKDQNAKVNGSIRGLLRERLETYKDPYKPQPEVLIPDSSIEIETQEDYDKVCQMSQ